MMAMTTNSSTNVNAARDVRCMARLPEKNFPGLPLILNWRGARKARMGSFLGDDHLAAKRGVLAASLPALTPRERSQLAMEVPLVVVKPPFHWHGASGPANSAVEDSQ